MKLRFDVDAAACARAGMKHPASPAVIDIDPAQIKLDARNLIADRLIGNDVCQLWNSDKGTNKSVDAVGNPVRVVAEAPTFEALMKALRKDEQVVQARRSCHRAIAPARANSGFEQQPILSPNGVTQPFIVQTTPHGSAAVKAVKAATQPRAATKKPRKWRAKVRKVAKRK